jgi:hypothetical protein
MRYLNRKNWLSAILVLVLAILLNSCATILGGKKNTVNVKPGNPDKALVFIDGELLGEAPLKVRVSKYKLQEGSILEIKKEGFQTLRYEVVRTPHVVYVAADILFGLIPLVVDVADGNIYRPNTRNIEYVLTPVNKDNQENSNLKNSSR